MIAFIGQSDLTSAAITVGAFLTAAALVAKFFRRPSAWVWSHLFGEPIGEWAREKVILPVVAMALEPIQRELTTNGGSSLKDAVKRLEANLESGLLVVDRIERELTTVGVHADDAEERADAAVLQAAAAVVRAEAAVERVDSNDARIAAIEQIGGIEVVLRPDPSDGGPK